MDKFKQSSCALGGKSSWEMLKIMFPAHNKSAHGGETENLESNVLQGMLTKAMALRQFLEKERQQFV